MTFEFRTLVIISEIGVTLPTAMQYFDMIGIVESAKNGLSLGIHIGQ